MSIVYTDISCVLFYWIIADYCDPSLFVRPSVLPMKFGRSIATAIQPLTDPPHSALQTSSKSTVFDRFESNGWYSNTSEPITPRTGSVLVRERRPVKWTSADRLRCEAFDWNEPTLKRMHHLFEPKPLFSTPAKSRFVQ